MSLHTPSIGALNLPIKSCMRCKLDLVTVSPFESVSSLIYRMVNSDIGAAIVVEKEKAVGMITERDVLERVLARHKDAYMTKAKDIMSKPVISIDCDCLIRDALVTMRKFKIRRLVVTEYGSLIGLVTERRLLGGFLGQIY